MSFLPGQNAWFRRIVSCGHTLLCLPIHSFLVTVVIAAVATWFLFAWSYRAAGTLRVEERPDYPLGRLDPAWVSPILNETERERPWESHRGQLPPVYGHPPLYGQDPMIETLEWGARAKRGRTTIWFRQQRVSLWMEGAELEHLPAPFAKRATYHYERIKPRNPTSRGTPHDLLHRLGFRWKNEGKEKSDFGYFPAHDKGGGATDLIEHKLSLQIGFPLWLPGITLTLASLIYLRQRRRGWVRWRRRRKGLCLGCGYMLKGLPDEAGCPECGMHSKTNRNEMH